MQLSKQALASMLASGSKDETIKLWNVESGECWKTLRANSRAPIYSRQPMCELALEQGFNFLFTCLPESHPPYMIG